MKSTFTYRSETWKFNRNLESKLMSIEMDFLGDRRDTQKYKKITNYVIKN